MNSETTSAQTSALRFLICPPRYFAVTYSINPWMDPGAWADDGTALHGDAGHQWAGLRRVLLAAGATIETLKPAPRLPDLVFTANAAIVLDRKALLARFRHRERQDEQPVFAAAFRALQARGLIEDISELPAGITQEGAGDCIWDPHRRLFWTGWGFRSDAHASHVIQERFGVRCVPLALADPRFYHLDTAFCALPCGGVLYYPGAFTATALETIQQHVMPAQRIQLDLADATRFAANAVCLGRVLLLSSCSDALQRRLEVRGYTVAKTPLRAFLRSGGSASCLTLRLDHQTQGEETFAVPVRPLHCENHSA